VFSTIIIPTDLHIMSAITNVSCANSTEVPENSNEEQSVYKEDFF